MRDLISASIAAISRYSPASSSSQLLHELDVLHVLARDLRDRDVEDVEVLAPDQVQQQVERPLERLEEYLERLRRDVEVARQLRDRLAFHDRERHFPLRGRAGAFRRRDRRWCLRHEAKIRLGRRLGSLFVQLREPCNGVIEGE